MDTATEHTYLQKVNLDYFPATGDSQVMAAAGSSRNFGSPGCESPPLCVYNIENRAGASEERLRTDRTTPGVCACTCPSVRGLDGYFCAYLGRGTLGSGARGALYGPREVKLRFL